MQVYSNTRRPIFGLIKAFHMGGSTLRKLSHPVESSTTFNSFTQKVKCKNQFSKLIPTSHSKIVCVNESRGGICREGKFMTYNKLTCQTTKSTNTANYKAPCIAARFCYHYSKTNRNLPSVMQKTNHTLARVSDDISSPARVSDDISSPTRVSDDTSSPACISDDIGEPIRL